MKRILIHISFWLIYLILQTYVEYAWISSSFANMTEVRRFLLAFQEELTLCLARVPMVYITFYLLQVLGVRQKKNLLAFILMLVVLSFFTFFHRILQVYIILPYLYTETDIGPVFFPMRLILAFLDLILVAGVANAIALYLHQQQMQVEQQALMREKLSAELHLLKAQTNPHFLFNTLNNIYALARKNSSQTADVVIKLSKLLRFMLYESSKKSILVADEIKLLEDYIELEKIRYNDRLSIHFEKEIDDLNAGITPLILLPFIENAFKHGSSETRFETYININLILKNRKLDFKVSNSYDCDIASGERVKTGLNNVRRQLELVYKKFDLIIEKDEHKFNIHLKIDLASYVDI